MDPSLPYQRGRDRQEISNRFVDEPPLRRPEGRELSRSLSDATVMFSVDTSGSTHGIVLSEEKSAIREISDLLDTEARAGSLVGPWDEATWSPRSVKQLSTLVSGGGTDPCIILHDDTHLRAIHNSDVWILLTDGQISEHAIFNFASMVPRKEIHSKPCIIIVFAYRAESPAQANISVGVSLYSIVPDCLFLFHDVDTKECFIFQSKGCFDVLNAQKTKGKILDTNTQWWELPRVTYRDFKRIRLPAKRDLKPHEIMLQEGLQINFDELLAGHLSASQVDKIFDNDDNLNAVILTASTRGKRDQVRQWIQGEKTYRSLCVASRRDTSSAQQLVAQILNILQGDFGVAITLPALRYKLQAAHRANWLSLIQSLDEETRGFDEHSQVIANAIERINILDESGISSPVVLSPIGSSRSRTMGSAASQYRYRPTSVPLLDPAPLTRAKRNQSRSIVQGQATQKTIFIPGYRRINAPKPPLIQDCSICGQESGALVLLLRDCPTNDRTEGFAAPGSLVDVSCPLALAFYPETDIVSQLHCCDSCAFYIVNARLTVGEEHITGALPIDIDLMDKMNRATWLHTVKIALQSRFSEDILPLTMLGIATRKLDELSSNTVMQVGSERELRPALRRFCSNLVPHCVVSFGNDHHTAITLALHDFDQYLCKWLDHPGLQDVDGGEYFLELLKQPFESFLFLSRYTQWVDLLQETRCIFVKLIIHMIDECMAVNPDPMEQDNEPENGRQKSLQSKLRSLESQSSVINGVGPVLLDLVAGGIIEETAYRVLVASIGPWQTLSDQCEGALDCVLKLLVEKLGDDQSMFLYDSDGEVAVFESLLSQSESFRAICRTPWKPDVVAAFQAQVV